jgi:hypothetical protein
MAFEKFGKAALLRSGAISLSSATSSHRAASRMIASMKLQRGLMTPMGGPLVWHAAFDAIEKLENAHPQLAGRSRGAPQLEYPWASASGEVLSPSRHLPIALQLANPRSKLAMHVLDFASKLDRNFDRIFP